MQQRIKHILCLAAMGLSASAAGSLYPVITSVTTETLGGRQAIYHVTAELQDIGAAGDQIVPYNFLDNGRLGIVFRHYHPAGDSWKSWPNSYPTGTTDTYSGAGRNAFAQQGGQFQLFTDGREPGHECIGFMSYPGSNFFWSAVRSPIPCFVPPPAPEWCKITTPEIVLDHGTVTLSDANSHSASANGRVECSAVSTVRFTLPSGSEFVSLQEGARARVRVNGAALDTPQQLPAGASTFSVSDSLEGITESGWYEGSAVLTIDLL